MKSVFRTLLTGAALLPLSMAASAQDLPATDLNVVGSWSNLPLYQEFERKFWEETVPAESGGAISVNMTTFDQMGVAGADVYRMLGDGVFDVGMTVADYTVGDAPELEGLDVPLIAMDGVTARKMVEAAKPWVAEIMRDRFNAHALAIAPYPPQIVFCNAEISGLDDLVGKKIRGSGRMTSLFLEALGAEGITLAFSEVPGALERGVIDCAVTGAGSGYASGWHESSTHLVNLPLGGWDPVGFAMNKDSWESLDAETQTLLREQVAALEEKIWSNAAADNQIGIDCNTGGDCPVGTALNLTLVEITPEDQRRAVELTRDVVLPRWNERCAGECAETFAQTVAPLLDTVLNQ